SCGFHGSEVLAAASHLSAPKPAKERHLRCALLELLDQGLECGDLVVECLLPGLRQLDPGAGSFALVSLLDADKAGFLEDVEVLGEVSGGEVEGGSEVGELYASGLLGHGEDAEPDSLMDDVVEAVGGVVGHAVDGPWARWISARRRAPTRSTLASTRRCGR